MLLFRKQHINLLIKMSPVSGEGGQQEAGQQHQALDKHLRIWLR
jgi:hypothetical protein